MAPATASALRQRMMELERSFRDEQSHALDKFLTQQRSIFEQSLALANVQERTPRIDSVPPPEYPRSGQARVLQRGDNDISEYDSSDSDAEEVGDESLALAEDRSLLIPLDGRAHAMEEITQKSHMTPRNDLQRLCVPIVGNGWFTFFTSAVVLSTVLQLGFSTHYKVKAEFEKERAAEEGSVDLSGTTPIGWLMDLWIWANLVSFFIELFLRIGAEQQGFFCPPRRRLWNFFDLLLLGDQLAAAISKYDTSLWTSLWVDTCFLRVIRLVRMIRVFEVFPELREMLYSFVACAGSIGWSLVLMFTFFWMYACFLMEISVWYATRSEPEERERYAGDLAEYWNGIFYSMLSLIYTITGGQSWGELARPFFTMNPWLGVSYTLFVVITLFGLLNVLVGIFVRSTERISLFDRDIVLADALLKRNERIREVQELFREIDEKSTGRIDEHDFVQALHRPRTQAFLLHLQINCGDPRAFFRKLDINGSGKMNIAEFTNGCMDQYGSS